MALRLRHAGAVARQEIRQATRTPHDPPLPPDCTRPQEGAERDVDSWLRRRFEGRLRDIEVVEREDLDLVGRAGLGRGWTAACGS